MRTNQENKIQKVKIMKELIFSSLPLVSKMLVFQVWCAVSVVPYLRLR